MELLLIIVVLFIAIGVILHLLWKDNHISNNNNVLPPTLTPADRPGTGWYNEWLMERPLNQEYRIKQTVRVNEPYLGMLKIY